MGSGRVINENLVANVALLAGGTCCLLGGPVAVGIFGVLAAPAVGIGGWGLAKWFKRLSDKNPESYKAIRRIQDHVNVTLTGDFEFADADPEDLVEADVQLSKLVARFWPSPKVIAELATNMDGFPNAIATHVMDEINGSAFATGLFEKPPIIAYAIRVLSLSLEAAFTDRDYYEKLKPHLFVQSLKLTGAIKRDVSAFTTKLDAAQNTVGEALSRIEGKVDEANAKLDQLVKGLLPEIGTSKEEEKKIRQTIAEMLLSDRQASQDAVAELMADPARPAAATNRLKQAIAEQSDARKEATRNEIALLEQIVAINYFTNGLEAVSALEMIVDLAPNDIENWNRLGELQLRLGEWEFANKAFSTVLKISLSISDISSEAWAYCHLGIVSLQQGKLDNSVLYSKKSMTLHQELGSKWGMATVYGNLGIVMQLQGDFDGANKCFEKAVILHSEIGRDKGVADNYGNLGNVANIRGDYKRANTFFSKALSLHLKLDDKEGIANDYGNLGIIASALGDFTSAEFYHKESLAIEKSLGRQHGMADDYGNLSNVALKRGDLNGAILYLKQSLEIEKKLGRKVGMASDYRSLGVVAEMQGDLSGAILHHRKSLVLEEEMGRRNKIAIQNAELGILEKLRGDIGKARSHLEVSLDVFIQLGDETPVKKLEALLSDLK